MAETYRSVSLQADAYSALWRVVGLMQAEAGGKVTPSDAVLRLTDAYDQAAREQASQ